LAGGANAGGFRRAAREDDLNGGTRVIGGVGRWGGDAQRAGQDRGPGTGGELAERAVRAVSRLTLIARDVRTLVVMTALLLFLVSSALT
jgi:hypothetical protein